MTLGMSLQMQLNYWHRLPRPQSDSVAAARCWRV